MEANLPDYRKWYYIECLEAADGWDDGDNHLLVKFCSPNGIHWVHGQSVHYEHSRIETFNFCDYADKPEPPSIESRLNIVEWEIAGIKNLIKELKDVL
jgi:hypothetical protein